MELITVSQTIIGQSAVNAVNSRELYEALGLAKGQYSRWAEKNIIEPYCLNEDYIGVRHDVEGNNITTFIVTIELGDTLSALKSESFLLHRLVSVCWQAFPVSPTVHN